MFPRDAFRGHYRRIFRIEGLASASYPTLDTFDGIRIQADRRQFGSAFRRRNADDDVTAIQVLIIVGERAQGVEHLETRGLFIPGRLQFDTGGFQVQNAPDTGR
nr:MAG: hypothetical protein BECKTC1821E_GA0114239_10432 [Candidatus Kentron sp. TC]